jgi:hypothetical protein
VRNSSIKRRRTGRGQVVERRAAAAWKERWARLRIAAVLIALGIMGWSAAAGAHGKATERDIPIGQSPDSGRYTVLGRLAASSPPRKSCTRPTARR